MKFARFISVSLIIASLHSHSLFGQIKFTPPVTAAHPVTDTLFNVLLTDNYRWLEDKTDPRVIEWTKAQHDYGIYYLQQTQHAHMQLREQLRSFIDRDEEGPMLKAGKRFFQIIRHQSDQQSSLYTILDGKKVLLWDPLQADSSGNTSIEHVEYSFDGEMAAIQTQQSGAEIPTIYIVETRNGRVLCPPLQNAFDYHWTKDQHHAYFTLRTREAIIGQLPQKTYCWKLGDPLENAVLVGQPRDAQRRYFIYDSRYSDVSFLGEEDNYSNICRIKKTGSPGPGRLIYSRPGFFALPEAIGDKLYLLTNDHAPDLKLMTADKNNPGFEHWKTLIPGIGTSIDAYAVTRKNIIILTQKDLQSRLLLFALNGRNAGMIQLPDKGNITDLHYDRDEDSVFITVSTSTSPPKTFIASPSDFAWRLYYQEPSAADMSNIVDEIKFYTAKDGTKIPVILIHRRDMRPDGENPVLLTGYGGFDDGIHLSYEGINAFFLNQGGILVEAGIRGGNEYGEKWHRAGMLDKKQNCFDDFNSCAEWLIAQKYTRPEKIVAQGSSNGGLLMGAVATQRPDLYKAILCDAALLDMVRYHRFLIARFWIPEFGVSEKQNELGWLLSYSPYHHLRYGVDLPSILVIAGANDSRVDPMHSKKFVAALQNNPGQLSPVILHINYNSGHGPGQTTQERIDNEVFKFEFILNQLGM